MSLATQTPVVEIESLVKSREVGYSLEAPFYTSPEIFDLDIQAIFARHWLFSAAESEIPEAGDYVTIDIGPYSVIILRDDDEDIRAFHNVCRHRGSRLLKGPCGEIGNIVCPYHQWTYRTDGDLIFAEAQPPTFDRSRFGLKPVHVRNVAGLIFICLDENPPPDFDEIADFIEPFLTPYDLGKAKVAHQIDLPEEGNWKLVMENNRECQHCDGAHPERVSAYFPLFGYSEDDITPRLRPAFERYQAASAALERARSLRQFPPQRPSRARLASDRLPDLAPAAGRCGDQLRPRRRPGLHEADGDDDRARVRRPVPALPAELLVPLPQRPRRRVPGVSDLGRPEHGTHHVVGAPRRRRRRRLRLDSSRRSAGRPTARTASW